MKITPTTTKQALQKSKLPATDFVINPYTGCQHACIYCYADFMKRFTGHQGEKWGDFVDVKTNAAETIDPAKIKPGSTILIGSVTDPYQPIEAKYQITRQCLEKLLPVKARIEILTKSALVLRDIDLLKRFRDLRVGISLGVLDEGLARKLEPCAASPKKRLEALRQLHEAGIPTYIFISPIFPEITDFKEILKRAKPHVDEALFENLNIRPNNRARILDFIKQNKPDLLPLYQNPLQDYWSKLEREIRAFCKSQNINCSIFFHHK